MEKRVEVTISEGVADVRLVRADKMNALDAAMFDALVATSARLACEKGLRAVVLSGEGRSFCAGLDMGRFAAMKDQGGNGIAGGEKRDLSARSHGLANFPQQAVWGWRQLPVPVIAAIQGVAFGGGFQLALGADMRFLAPDARMSIMEIKWGLVPDMAGTPILASLVRDDILRELTYTGRIFSAQEALSYGLANFPQQAVWGWRQLPVPVIAAIQGVAFGGGFQLALGADMRLLAPDARMSIMEIKWGLVPDMAGTPILASLVRDDILRELTFTGRIFSAQEALSYGLATRICDDPRAAAFELAREIAGKSPDAIRACKRMLNNLTVDPGPALLAESVEQMKLMGSPNQLEAVRANIDKRAPRFADV